MKRVLCAMILSLWVPLVAQAADRFVSRTGSGSTCLTGTPCTLQQAMNIVSPGDHIKLRSDGTPYDVSTNLPTSGTNDTTGRIFIEPDTGHTPVLRFSTSQSSSPVIQVTQISYITIQNLTFDCGAGQPCSRVAIRLESNPSGTAGGGVEMLGIQILNNVFQNWGGTAAQAGLPYPAGVDRGAIIIGGAGNQGNPSCPGSYPPTADPCPGVPNGTIIRGNTFSNIRQSAISISHSANIIVEDNTFTGITCGRDVDATNTVGIKLTGTRSEGHIIRNNSFHDFEQKSACGISDADGYGSVFAIWCDVGPDANTIESNLIYNINQGDSADTDYGSGGILIEADCNGWIVKNNIIHDTGVYGVANNNYGANANESQWTQAANQYLNNTIYNTRRGFHFASGKADAKNNIVQSVSEVCILTSYNYPTAYAIDYNLYYDPSGNTIGTWGNNTGGPFQVNFATWQSASGKDAHGLNVDPRLANLGSGDFRLCTAAGVPDASCAGASPAINAGVTLANNTTDFTCNPPAACLARPGGAAYDMGAYEADAAAGDPTAPSAPTNLRVVSP